MIKRQRTINLANSKIDVENRTVEVAFSSTAEVDRGGYVEVLSHERGAMDTSRLTDGAAVLVDHDWTDQVGVVESVRIDHAGGVGRALLRFGNSARASEIFQDIQDGIRRHISFGYIVNEERQLDGKRGVEVTKYQPYEISIVSVPADVTVGVGRDLSEQNENKNMSTEQKETLLTAERERVAKITRFGQKFGFTQEAERAIAEGTDAAEFAEQMSKTSKPGETRSNESDAERAGITHKDLAGYSLARAIEAAATGDWSKAGREREISDALRKVRGKDEMVRGFTVPHEALVRSFQTTANSEQITPTQYRPDLMVQMLREQSLIGRLGAKMHSGLVGSKEVEIPKQLTDVQTQWLAENQDVTDDTLTFGSIKIAPSTLAASVPITRQLRLQSNPMIDTIVRSSIMAAVAAELDRVTFFGSGTAPEPKGIMNMNIQTKTLADTTSGVPTWSEIVDMETMVDEVMLDSGVKYLMSRAIRGEFKKKLKVVDAGNDLGFILEPNGDLNGSTAIAHKMFNATKQMIAGDFSALVWGFWSSLDLRVDTATYAARDGIVIRAFQDAGLNVERENAFVMTPAITSS